jgi:NAD(P)-dependent dehydrogenase (short-subunit alcohol dehydrogenase family)
LLPVPVTFLSCDYTSLASIKECANAIKAQTDRLDILMCYAGAMVLPAGTTKDGYEIQFGINHLSHPLLVKHLSPNSTNAKLRRSHYQHDINSLSTGTTSGDRLQDTDIVSRKARQDDPRPQMVYSQGLAKQYPQITSVSVHPGIIMTGLFDNMSFFTKLPALLLNTGKTTPVEHGSYNQLWAATVTRASWSTESIMSRLERLV